MSDLPWCFASILVASGTKFIECLTPLVAGFSAWCEQLGEHVELLLENELLILSMSHPKWDLGVS